VKKLLLRFEVQPGTFKTAVGTDTKPCAFYRQSPMLQGDLQPEFVGYTSGLAAGVAYTYSEYTTGQKARGSNPSRGKTFFSPLNLPNTASYSMGIGGTSWWVKRQGA